MQRFRTIWLTIGCAMVLASPLVSAQDLRPGEDTAAPAPTPTAPSPDDIDIESLREPGSTAKLFPDQPPATPAPGANTGTPGVAGGRRGANARQPGGSLGKKRNSGRRRDVLVDQADSDPLQVRVAYRRAKTAAMARDPGLAVLLKQAADADTDPVKREYLKQYYTRLYASVEKIDRSPELKKHVEVLREVASARYDPRRRDVGGDEDITLGRGGGRRGGGRNR